MSDDNQDGAKMRSDVEKMDAALERLLLFALGAFVAYAIITFIGFVVLGYPVVFLGALVVAVPWAVQCAIVNRRIKAVRRRNRER